MQKLLFLGLLGCPTPEGTPKFDPLHPNYIKYDMILCKNMQSLGRP